MIKRILAISICVLLLCGLGIAAPGGADDPALTKSYVDKFIQRLYDYPDDKLDTVFSDYRKTVEAAIIEMEELCRNIGMPEYYATAITREVFKKINLKSSKPTQAALSPGDVLQGGDGCQFRVMSGIVETKGTVIDLTSGKVLASGSLVSQRHLLAATDGAELISHNKSTVEVMGWYRYLPVPSERYLSIAEKLYDMGLAKGTGKGFDLPRPAIRVEGITMLLNLLGESAAAEVYTGKTKFTDVPAWARSNVAYAFDKGYTKGATSTLFDANASITGDQYCTLLLRALNYKDDVDFTWNKSLDFAASLGIITKADSIRMRGFFNRDELYYLSYKFLSAKYKGTNTTLLQNLITSGAVKG